MPFVYMVRCADDTLYTGWAMDVVRRVAAHNAGRGARYTRTHGPVELVYAEEVATRGDALRRERAIKRYPRAKKLALCEPLKPAKPPHPHPSPPPLLDRRSRRGGGVARQRRGEGEVKGP